MAFTSFSFILLLLGFVLLTQAFPTPRGRALVLAGCSGAFIASYVTSPLQLAPFGAFLVTGYAGVEVLRRTRSRALLGLGLLLLVSGFVWLKGYGILGSEAHLPFPYLTLGLSYVLFRIVHLMVDAQQGELVARIPGLSFLVYTINFLSFTAGPVQLYPDFAESQRAPLILSREGVAASLSRVVKGFVKVAMISAILQYAFSMVSGRLLAGATQQALPLFVLSAVLYTTYLYANFSGYMDIVIGAGELTGQRLPENFNQPFRARSFLDFWARWHMTLSNWFKLYLFNPLLKGLAKRYPSGAAAPYLAMLAFFITFLVMGLWHGTTAVFVVYGLLLALGASVNKWWQVLATARLGKKAYKAWCEKPSVAYLSRGLTFAYFAVALTCLWVDLDQLRSLGVRLGAAGVVGTYALLSATSAVAFAIIDAIERRSTNVRERFRAAPAFAHDFALALQILLVLSVSSFFHKAPEFVYRAF